MLCRMDGLTLGDGQTNPSYPFTLKGDRVILTLTGNAVREKIFV